jgi:hypothetical protein
VALDVNTLRENENHCQGEGARFMLSRRKKWALTASLLLGAAAKGPALLAQITLPEQGAKLDAILDLQDYARARSAAADLRVLPAALPTTGYAAARAAADYLQVPITALPVSEYTAARTAGDNLQVLRAPRPLSGYAAARAAADDPQGSTPPTVMPLSDYAAVRSEAVDPQMQTPPMRLASGCYAAARPLAADPQAQMPAKSDSTYAVTRSASAEPQLQTVAMVDSPYVAAGTMTWGAQEPTQPAAPPQSTYAPSRPTAGNAQVQTLPAPKAISPPVSASPNATVGKMEVKTLSNGPGVMASSSPGQQAYVNQPASPISTAGGPGASTWQRCKEKLQACFVGYPEEFIAPPLGYFVGLHIQAQVASGEAARMVLHDFDFIDGSDRLNLRGNDQLVKISCMLPRNFFPIIIERTPNRPGLAEARRAAVINTLAQGNFPVPPERVIVGTSIAPDLRGADAELINKSYIKQIETSGQALKPGLSGVGNISPLGGGTSQ